MDQQQHAPRAEAIPRSDRAQRRRGAAAHAGCRHHDDAITGARRRSFADDGNSRSDRRRNGPCVALPIAGTLAAADLGAASLAFAAAPATDPYRKLLVLVELKGGNDGLNTAVPYTDATYYALRPKLAIARNEVVQLSDRVGLHPALAPLAAFWRDRELAVLQGVGYPAPHLSHSRS